MWESVAQLFPVVGHRPCCVWQEGEEEEAANFFVFIVALCSFPVAIRENT